MKKFILAVSAVVALFITSCGGNGTSKTEEKKITLGDKESIPELKAVLEKSPLADKEFAWLHFVSEGTLNDVFSEISASYFNPEETQELTQRVDAKGASIKEPEPSRVSALKKADKLLFVVADIPYDRIATDIEEINKFVAEEEAFKEYEGFKITQIMIGRNLVSKFPKNISVSYSVHMKKKGDDSHYYNVSFQKWKEGGEWDID